MEKSYNLSWMYEKDEPLFFYGDVGATINYTTQEKVPLDVNMQYSEDGKNWADWEKGVTLTLTKAVSKIYIRNTTNTLSTSNISYLKFVVEEEETIAGFGGNVNSLINYAPLSRHCFYNLFSRNKIITGPRLPATTLAAYCYAYMFEGCSKLIQAPALPATTLANYCYYYMFQDCTSLANPPALPATILNQYCYCGMFERCTSLTAMPELPATALDQYCYESMFYRCTSLENILYLPATTLAAHCYENLFFGCTSLKKIIKLPALYLPAACYKWMFRFISNDIYIFANASGPYINEYRIPSSGVGAAESDSTDQMFYNGVGSPEINKTYYTNAEIIN